MSRHGYSLSIVSLAAIASLTLSCSSSPRRMLQSIVVSPASADAQSFPNGQVAYTATGTYNTSPHTVTPLTANWGIANLDGSPTAAITVDANGVAQCSAGASGGYSVGAWGLMDPTTRTTCASSDPYGEPGCNAVLGTAQLTCP